MSLLIVASARCAITNSGDESSSEEMREVAQMARDAAETAAYEVMQKYVKKGRKLKERRSIGNGLYRPPWCDRPDMFFDCGMEVPPEPRITIRPPRKTTQAPKPQPTPRPGQSLRCSMPVRTQCVRWMPDRKAKSVKNAHTLPVYWCLFQTVNCGNPPWCRSHHPGSGIYNPINLPPCCGELSLEFYSGPSYKYFYMACVKPCVAIHSH